MSKLSINREKTVKNIEKPSKTKNNGKNVERPLKSRQK